MAAAAADEHAAAAVWRLPDDDVADAPPLRPTPLTQDGLLGLFKGEQVGRNVKLEPATFEDMCGKVELTKKSLEVVYDTV